MHCTSELCAAWCRKKARPLGRALNEYLTTTRRGGKLRQGCAAYYMVKAPNLKDPILFPY